MCDAYNVLDCPITLSTINGPDATFVSGVVGNDLQFKGITSTNMTLVQNTNNLVISGNPLPPVADIGVTGLHTGITYGSLSAIQQLLEQDLVLLSSVYNTGIYVGSVLTISVAGYYRVCFNPVYVNFDQEPGLRVIFRLRNSAGVVVQFYSTNTGNDEITTSFSGVIRLLPDTYRFTVQVLGLSTLGYSTFTTEDSSVSVKLIKN